MADRRSTRTVPQERSVEARVAEYFDSEAPGYAASYSMDSHVGYFFRCRARLVKAILDDRRPGALVDVGCGPGVMVDTVRSAGHTYDGVDVSPGMIHVATDSFAGDADVRFLVARAQELPFDDASFDTALCLGLLEYVPREDRQLALSEVRRVLRPGGLVVLAVLNRRSPIWFWRTAKSWFKGRVGARPGVATADADPEPFTSRRAQKLLDEAGFSVDGAGYYAYNIMPARIFDAVPSLWTKVSDLLDRMVPRPFRWIAMGTLLVATVDGPR